MGSVMLACRFELYSFRLSIGVSMELVIFTRSCMRVFCLNHAMLFLQPKSRSRKQHRGGAYGCRDCSTSQMG